MPPFVTTLFNVNRSFGHSSATTDTHQFSRTFAIVARLASKEVKQDKRPSTKVQSIDLARLGVEVEGWRARASVHFFSVD